MTVFVKTPYLIQLTISGSDITSASSVELAVLMPNGLKATWPANLSGNVVSTTITNTDMTEPGLYRVQVIATIGGDTFPSDIVKITAEPRLD